LKRSSEFEVSWDSVVILNFDEFVTFFSTFNLDEFEVVRDVGVCHFFHIIVIIFKF